ncbi:MAG: hypothetical protein U0Q11_12330 [Vicinamibacterales bacterium]
MRFTMLMVVASLLALPHPAAAQDATSSTAQTATLLPGIQGVHFAISTRRDEAQKFFDQGLALIYASNQDEAVRSFRRAAEIDPGSPMPHWGIAVAYAQNLGTPVDPARVKAGSEAAKRSVELAVRAPAKERAFAAAVAKRFPADASGNVNALAVEHAGRDASVVAHYPNDSHAATLYALEPDRAPSRRIVDTGGTPAEGTTELIEVLERVLEREPDHVGANHYFIIATSRRSRPSADSRRAKKIESLMPGAGPCCIWPHTPTCALATTQAQSHSFRTLWTSIVRTSRACRLPAPTRRRTTRTCSTSCCRQR